MPALRLPRFRMPSRTPTWGAALVAVFGCALPLSLGLLSNHPGFLWAALGAFQAARANPLHRSGMLRMMLLIGLGACSSGLGFWAAESWLASLLLFAFCGLLLAWLQRFGNEAGKLGLGICICLCLGQGYPATAELPNPLAVAALFGVGGLWVALLAFFLRGVHGLRTWPHLPHLRHLLKALRRHARRLPRDRWRLHALSCTLSFALAGGLAKLLAGHQGHWLTLTVLGTLYLQSRVSRQRLVQVCSSSLALSALLALIGHSLPSSAAMVALVLALILIGRALQANRYRAFMLQNIGISLLLAEALALDWLHLEPRLLAALYGFGLALLPGLLFQALFAHRLQKSDPARQAGS